MPALGAVILSESPGEFTTEEYMVEVERIISTAKDASVILRLLGSTAFRIHCPNYGYLGEKMKRALTDIDLVGYSRQRDDIISLFRKLGYTYDFSTHLETALLGGRLIFWRKDNSKLHVDIFLDKLQMCHTIDFKGRLELEEKTIPLAEMFLEKVQIVNMAEKDVKDTIMLLREHSVSPSDKEAVNIEYIAGLLAKDWGFYYTVSQNLQKITQALDGYDVLTSEDKDDVRKKISIISEAIEKRPKSVGWKIRAKVGPKVKWYQEVEVAERHSI